jgi:hypothetical protein
VSSNWLRTLMMMITLNRLGAYVPQLFTITCALSPVSYVLHNLLVRRRDIKIKTLIGLMQRKYFFSLSSSHLFFFLESINPGIRCRCGYMHRQ